MGLHFSKQEFSARVTRLRQDLKQHGLDGILLFRQESMYYLTGYDTFGYVFFQCLFYPAEGEPVLLTRAPDLRQAQHTSTLNDIRIWVDGPDADPAGHLKTILSEHGFAGARLGVEWDAYGLTAASGMKLTAALSGFCQLEDASLVVSRMRVIKSDAEIKYVRRAAELADDAYDRACDLTRDGADEGEILAAMQGAIFKGGGDYPGNEFIIGSGRDALLCRYFSGRRRLDARDQLTLEWAGAYRHYHAAMMRTFIVGNVSPGQQKMYQTAYDALRAVKQAIKPGNTFADAFDAHAETIDDAGMSQHRLNACGYSLGTTFSPNWMDWPMLYAGNPVQFEAGMTIFCHMIIYDSDAGLAMTLGETVLVDQDGHQRLSRSPLDLVVK